LPRTGAFYRSSIRILAIRLRGKFDSNAIYWICNPFTGQAAEIAWVLAETGIIGMVLRAGRSTGRSLTLCLPSGQVEAHLMQFTPTFGDSGLSRAPRLSIH
jgi:hypothetical protein